MYPLKNYLSVTRSRNTCEVISYYKVTSNSIKCVLPTCLPQIQYFIETLRLGNPKLLIR